MSTRLADSWGNGNYQFQWATGVAVDRVNGNIYVTDGPNQRVQVYNSSLVYVATIGENGVSGADNAHFNYPIGVEVNSNGNIYIADINNCRVQKYNSNRQYLVTFGTTGSCSNSYADVSAEDVTVDGQGRVYVAGWDNRVEVFNSTGAYLTTIGGSYGSHSSQFRGAAGVAVDSKNNVYVADFTNARIRCLPSACRDGSSPISMGLAIFVIAASPWKFSMASLYSGTVNWDEGAQIFRSSDGRPGAR